MGEQLSTPGGTPASAPSQQEAHAGGMALEDFFLGTHEPAWLSQLTLPLFVSRRRLERLRHLPQAKGPWALDSGGFTELSLHGAWTISESHYAALVQRYVLEIGQLQLVAPMDWMVEPWIIARTGLSVRDHQRRTLENYLRLRSLAPHLPWMPVLQGWTIGEYLDHAAAYERAGVALASLPRVAVGSVCRRQGTAGVALLLAELARAGLRLHVFGMKTTGLLRSAGSIVSADSLAWSASARKGSALPQCRGKHTRCNNCLHYALRWRERLLRLLDVDDPHASTLSTQLRLFSPDFLHHASPARCRTSLVVALS